MLLLNKTEKMYFSMELFWKEEELLWLAKRKYRNCIGRRKYQNVI
jgi:predicted metal-dependent hydrolase